MDRSFIDPLLRLHLAAQKAGVSERLLDESGDLINVIIKLLNVPKLSTYEKAREIIRLRDLGLSVPQICERLGLTRSSYKKITEKYPRYKYFADPHRLSGSAGA